MSKLLSTRHGYKAGFGLAKPQLEAKASGHFLEPASALWCFEMLASTSWCVLASASWCVLALWVPASYPCLHTSWNHAYSYWIIHDDLIWLICESALTKYIKRENGISQLRPWKDSKNVMVYTVKLRGCVSQYTLGDKTLTSYIAFTHRHIFCLLALY